MTKQTMMSSRRTGSRRAVVDAGNGDVIACRTRSDVKWDIRDKFLPQVPLSDCDVFDAWPNGNCRRVYDTGLSPEAERHWSGWAMRNTNNHNKTVLKKSCLGLLVCSRDDCDVRLRPAICHKARAKQIGTPCSSASCDGLMKLVPCRGHRGYPVTHFWRADPASGSAIFFQSKGFHDHPRPEQPWSGGVVGSVKPEDPSPITWMMPITPPADADDIYPMQITGKRNRKRLSSSNESDWSTSTKRSKLINSIGFPSPASDTSVSHDVTAGFDCGGWVAPEHSPPQVHHWKDELESEVQQQQQQQQFVQSAINNGRCAPPYTCSPSSCLASNPEYYPLDAYVSYWSPGDGGESQQRVRFLDCSIGSNGGHVTSPSWPTYDSVEQELSFYVKEEFSSISGCGDGGFPNYFGKYVDRHQMSPHDASFFLYNGYDLSDCLDVMEKMANGHL